MENKKLEIRLNGYAEEDVRDWNDLEIEFLLYAQCYEEALTSILSNIDYNRNTDKFSFAGMEEEYISPLDSSNIIAFIGRRGSGKTTAVNEFSKVLCSYHNHIEKWNSRLVYKNNNNLRYRFHVLAPIDASVLEDKEDLMEVILASMYQVFEKKAKKVMNGSDTVRRMVQEFNDAYKSYINVGQNNDKRSMYEESSISKLKDISISLKTKNIIAELTANFLKLLDGEEGSRDSYLVVVIDDLDMSPQNGFAMLEQLHKYWSNQRIIILIAIKYEQMKLMCNQHFADCITPKYGGVHETVFNKFYDKAKEISSDYLLKVLPLSNRIYMPENMLNENGIVIRQLATDEDEKKIKIKDFILDKIASKMNIYYDAVGLKRHFCLPDTVRELVTYNNFLDSLHSMEEIAQCGEERKMVLYDQNHEQFNGDIENRMAMRILDDDQLEVYQLIQKRNIERRAKYAVNFLHSWMEKSDAMGDKVDGQIYCYADLLQTIYELGRKDYKDKVLVHCILASFTTEMVREYYSYMNHVNREARDRSARRLQCLLGNTFGGKWFEEVMPKARSRKNTTSKVNMGYIANVDMGRLHARFKKNYTMENIEMEMVCFFSDVVPCMERLMLFFSNYRDAYGIVMNPVWSFEIRSGNVEKGYEIHVEITSKVNRATYDIFGFIGKEIEKKSDKGMISSNRKIIAESLIEPLLNCVQNQLRELKYQPDKIEQIIEQLRAEMSRKSIWFQHDEHANIAVPYYNLDMTYNVMKRVRTKLKENPSLGEATVYNYLRVAYKYLAEELYEEEKAYQNIPGQKPPHFYEDFVKSPFMKVFEITIAAGETFEEDNNWQQPEKRDTVRNFFNGAISSISEEITKGIMKDDAIDE